LRIRTLAKKLGFERIVLKNRKMNSYFISNPQSIFFETPTFQQIMQYMSVTGHIRGLTMKQSNNHLIMSKENVKTLKEARGILEEIVSKIQL